MKTITTHLFCFLSTALLLMGCGSPPKKAHLDDRPRQIETLFLGHPQEHHNSRAYMPILASAFAKNGINITYTEQLEDLNMENLERYDAVIVYANHENITPSQENALLDYVAEGHAFIPIHSASFCFKNSPKYIDLVGAQFQDHKTGTFTATIVAKDHPAMKSVEEFPTWDETYVHHQIADDITILMERVEGDHHEPWTWVKDFGKGKVFYTAYGHDERTWNNPGFQNLVKEGILWAVTPEVRKNWEAFATEIPKLVYEERDNIPNYEKRDPAPKYQLPLTPEESARLIQVPAGFELKLFASEPDIINPIAMNWDEKGRLWVIETVDYPNTVRDDKGTGDDRIKILEDTDGDGKADKVTVYADKLNLPTSFAFTNGGIIVSQAPYFLFLKDTDGDDKADVREVVIDGWGTYDTHAGPSNLQNGIDNKIYGVLGYSGFKGSIFGKEEEFRQGLYKFDRDFKNFEFLTRTSNNTWGLGITEDNAIFASTANNTHSVFMGIPNHYFKDVEGIDVQGSLKIDGHYDMHPITPNVRQVDVFGGFTAAAGHHFYTARAYPSSYWNKVAFVCEPTGGVVHIAKIVKEGAGYKEQDGGNLFAGADEWVSPVEAKVGPDGDVWVADWYNFIVQHNPTPTAVRGGYDAVNGPGNAYENPLRDKSRGRIWRVVPKFAEEHRTMELDSEDPKELVHALSNDNMFWRMTAQRLLVEKGGNEVLPDLYKLVNESSVDGLGLNAGALHALWTMEGLGLMASNEEAQSVAKGALYHGAAAVRRAAVQILPRTQLVDEAILASGVLADRDPSVRLAALLYFAEREPSDLIGETLYRMTEDDTISTDLWLSQALYIAGGKHHVGFVNAFLKAHPGYTPVKEAIGERQAQDYSDSAWKTMRLPQFIEDAGLDMDGVVWFRKNIKLDRSSIGQPAILSLGPINDSDITYLNGKKVGGMEQSWDKDRVYKIAAGVLKEGENNIAIRVDDIGGSGGIYGKNEQLYLQIGQQKLALAGDWKYDIEEDRSKRAKNPFEASSITEVLVKSYLDKTPTAIGMSGEATAATTVVNIGTVKNEMKYDVTEFEVKAGTAVELVFNNSDFMQHNLLILAQGAISKVGAAADKLAMDPNGAAQNYVPTMPEVLFATELVNPDQKVVLRFTAPSKPGNYPFICTFPGHWRIMQGVMKVTAQ